jgi:hypothetical protein
MPTSIDTNDINWNWNEYEYEYKQSCFNIHKSGQSVNFVVLFCSGKMMADVDIE